MTTDDDRFRRFLIRQLGPTRMPEVPPGKATPSWGDATEEPSDAELSEALERRSGYLHGVLLDTGDVDERRFDGQMFLGNGLRSLYAVRTLHDRLSHAISLLCGIQQGGVSDPDDLRRTEDDIMDVVRDVSVALTGHDVEFVLPLDATTDEQVQAPTPKAYGREGAHRR